MEYIHRANTWDDFQSDNYYKPACKVDSAEISQMPSGYDCPTCVEIVPGLQVMAELKNVCKNRHLIATNTGTYPIINLLNNIAVFMQVE